MNMRVSSNSDTVKQPLRIETVERFERFQRIRDDWRRLTDQAVDSFPMLTHEWLTAWWSAFARGQSILVILVWEGEDLVGAAPFLYHHKKFFLGRYRVLRPWVNSWVDKFTFLAVEPAEKIVDAILTQALTRTWDMLELPRLASDSPVSESIRRSLTQKRLRYGVEEDRRSPFLPLPDNWEQLLAQCSSSFRQNLKRKVRAAEKYPGIAFKLLTDDTCIKPITEVSLESWQHENGTSIASRTEIAALYSALIKTYGQRAEVRCALMTVHGEPAAFDLNVLHRDTLYNFKLGFKKKFAHLSAGVVLKAYLFQELLENRGKGGAPREYDFMGVSEPYKLQWSKQVRVHESFHVFADRPVPRVLHWVLYVVRPMVRERYPGLFRKTKQYAKAIGLRSR